MSKLENLFLIMFVQLGNVFTLEWTHIHLPKSGIVENAERKDTQHWIRIVFANT